MGTEFLRLRRKNALWRILRALLTGIAVALLVSGGLMAMFKLTTTDGRMTMCMAIGGGAGLVVAIVRWLLLHRSDLRAAEQMDEQHKLRERAQTMIAFREDEGVMAQLQREDTEATLKAVRSYGVKTSGVLAHILAVVLAAGVLAGSFVLPARAEEVPAPYVEPEFNASAWQLSALEALIVHVQESNMSEPAKAATIEELQDLRDTLNASITLSAFKAQVITVITKVYTYTDRVNSNDDIHDVLLMVDHDISESLCYTMGSLGNAQFATDVEEIGYQLSQSYVLATLGHLADELDQQLALIPATYVVANDYDETDRLYCAMLTFAQNIREVAGMVEDGVDNETIVGRMGEVTHELKGEANLALDTQTVTKEECIYVVETLCSIFGLSPSECPADPDPSYSKKAEDEDYTPSGGAPGSGDMQFAGDEQIFDYKKNEHVSYTTVIAEYYAAMLQAELEGTLSPEMKEYILKYFSQLYTG